MRCPAYELHCKSNVGEAHSIRLPLPTDVTLGTHKPMREGAADIACPACRQLHHYTGRELTHTFEEILEIRKLPPDPVPVRVDFACGHSGCGRRATVYTLRAPEESLATVLERLRDSEVAVDCAGGHRLVFAALAQWKVAEGPNCNPF